jgi:glycerol-3-phosphate acyltransferase PlsX
MGGDNPPELLFEAVIEASQNHSPSMTFVVFATKPVVEDLHFQHYRMMSNHLTARIEFHAVEDMIATTDDPLIALRTKKNASVLVAMRLLKNKQLDALVSVGNTGALIAASSLILSAMPGIKRPALLATLPSSSGKVVVIDIGGNLYCKAQKLVQFAQMGITYQRCRGKVSKPRVGLLNVGVESKKGTNELRQAYNLLETLDNDQKSKKKKAFSFIGNVEARELLEGGVDVVVTDGFTGNIFLKATEGAVAIILQRIKTGLKSSAKHPGIFEKISSTFDYNEYPGAIVCGVDGVVVKCHGNATPRMLYHSIIEVIALVDTKLIDQLKKQLAG